MQPLWTNNYLVQITWVHLFFKICSFYVTRMQTDSSNRSLPNHKKTTHPWWFWYSGVFLLHQTPLSLYLFLQTGSSRGLAEKERRGARWKKQNKFSDMPPEAERLCRRTDSPSSSCRTEEKIFKRRQKQRASPLTGKRAGGDAVSHNVKWSGSSVHVYSFMFVPSYWVSWQHYNMKVCVFACAWENNIKSNLLLWATSSINHLIFYLD